MEFVQDLLHSAVSRWRVWSPMQRTIFGIAAIVILAGALSIGFQSGKTRYVPLSLGKQFSSDELAGIEQRLREKRLTTFRREGNQLLVPADEQTAYDAALLQERQLPQDWASEWEQKLEQTNPFTSSRKLQMMKEIALAKELKRIIQGIDGIEEADVRWAPTETHAGLSRQQKVTASVNIRPEPGHTLAEQTIRAIQFSVANMVPNLEPQDVIVLDYSVGRHYQLEPEQARFETDLERWVDREVSRWHERLLPAVAHYWPGARLVVRPQEEELRQMAWQLLRLEGTDRATLPSFHTIEPALRQRFPEYMQLTVTLPRKGTREDAPAHAQQLTVQQEVLAALIGWLPASFDAHQLQVTVESVPADVARLDVAEGEPSPPSWQPVVTIAAASLLLLLVSRRLRPGSASSETGLKPAAASDESRDQASVITDAALPAVAAQTVTPLGDPELVADVLKHWLGSSRSAAKSDAPPPAAPGAD